MSTRLQVDLAGYHHVRNFAILNAYLDGYTQVDMASYLKLSKSLISKVVKSGDSLTGV